uniref:Uncharacterized protein n=1 Tax=Periophthalmus magnuspinnatus TaxID=409849 RepID=A0A3B4ACX3_9GOBI
MSWATCWRCRSLEPRNGPKLTKRRYAPQNTQPPASPPERNMSSESPPSTSTIDRSLSAAKPDAPEGPMRFDEVDATSVVLSWNPPLRDGGAPVSGYVVEQRDAHRPGWVPVSDSVSRPTFRFTNLIEGDEYFHFRVMACNAGGCGEPAEVPGVIKITEMLGKKPPTSPFHLYKDVYVVRQGGVVRLSVPIRGKPHPTCAWSKDGGPVSTAAMIAFTEDASELVIKGAERGDSGVYNLLLENRVGKKKAQIKVKVIGRPSAPQGPLVLDEVQANSVRVSWKPPSDDGGSEVLGYIVERREATRNAWYTVDSRVTDTQLVVKGLREGTEYHFKITAENAFGISGSLKTETPLIMDVTKSSVALSWARPKDDGGSEFKEVCAELWSRHGAKVTSTMFTVSGLNADAEYSFRIIAVNDIGESQPGPASDPVTCKDPFGESLFGLWSDSCGGMSEVFEVCEGL